LENEGVRFNKPLQNYMKDSLMTYVNNVLLILTSDTVDKTPVVRSFNRLLNKSGDLLVDNLYGNKKTFLMLVVKKYKNHNI
jgi:hypothetical protein